MIGQFARWGAALLLCVPGWAGAGAGTVAVSEEGQLDLSAFQGKVVYVDFWASWCKPCRKSFPWMNSMQQRYASRGLAVVTVNLDQDPAKARAFVARFAPAFPVAYDPGGRVARRWGVRGMPSSYIVDRQGRIVFSHVGFRERDRARLEQRIVETLEQTGGQS